MLPAEDLNCCWWRGDLPQAPPGRGGLLWVLHWAFLGRGSYEAGWNLLLEVGNLSSIHPRLYTHPLALSSAKDVSFYVACRVMACDMFLFQTDVVNTMCGYKTIDKEVTARKRFVPRNGAPLVPLPR